MMSPKPKRLAFHNANVFGTGFLSGSRVSIAVTKGMCVDGWIDVNDGSIRESMLIVSHSKNSHLKFLWSYIYYLYYMNREEISVFRLMTDEVTKQARADKFYHVVRSVINDFDQVIIFKDETPLDKFQLATFILKIVTKYKDKIKNPVLDKFRETNQEQMQLQMFSPSDIEVVLRTGEEQIAKAETKDMKNILNSDVILTVKRVPVQEAGFKKRRSKRS